MDEVVHLCIEVACGVRVAVKDEARVRGMREGGERVEGAALRSR